MGRSIEITGQRNKRVKGKNVGRIAHSSAYAAVKVPSQETHASIYGMAIWKLYEGTRAHAENVSDNSLCLSERGTASRHFHLKRRAKFVSNHIAGYTNGWSRWT